MLRDQSGCGCRKTIVPCDMMQIAHSKDRDGAYQAAVHILEVQELHSHLLVVRKT